MSHPRTHRHGEPPVGAEPQHTNRSSGGAGVAGSYGPEAPSEGAAASAAPLAAASGPPAQPADGKGSQATRSSGGAGLEQATYGPGEQLRQQAAEPRGSEAPGPGARKMQRDLSETGSSSQPVGLEQQQQQEQQQPVPAAEPPRSKL